MATTSSGFTPRLRLLAANICLTASVTAGMAGLAADEDDFVDLARL